MKILILNRYSRNGASSRLRTMQYVPLLEAAGCTVRESPFFGPEYLEQLYSEASTRAQSARAFAGRFATLMAKEQPDVIWLEKEALPWLPWGVERRFWPRVPVVSDFDDAVFHRYDLHRRPVIRRLLGRKIDGVMQGSTIVFAGNQYLADRAIAAGAARVEIVPTVVDLRAYGVERRPEPDGLPRIGWIGSPSTWKQYMVPMLPFLQQASAANNARLRVVGATTVPSSSWMESLPWSEETEVASIQSMDIGLMPLDDTPWSQGKCGYKLIQYMACGLPVVASPVGVNTQIVEHGVNGFLASTDAEWHEAIMTLLKDEGLRQRMGAAGRQKVEQQYSLQAWAGQVGSLLRQASETGRRA